MELEQFPPTCWTELDVDVYPLPTISSRFGLEAVMKCHTGPSRRRWLEVNISNANHETVNKLEAELNAKGLNWKLAAQVGNILVFI